MASLGALVVSLTAETAQFTAAMNKAAYQSQKNFDTMMRGAKGVAGVFAGLFAGGSLVSFAKSQLDAADALDKLSQKTGITVTELSRLQNAAELSGVSADELAGSLKKFSISVADAAQGGNDQAKAFERLGIKVKDANGVLRPTEEILYDVADAFASTADGARKTALAQELGKRGFENLIPLLNEGRDGLKKYSATFTDDFAKAAVAFNDNITKLIQNFNGLAAVILGPVISAVNQLFGTPVGKDLDQAIDGTKQKIEDLKEAIRLTEGAGLKGLFGSSEESVAKLKAQLILVEAELVRLQGMKPPTLPKTEVPAVDKDALKNQEKVSEIIKKQVDDYNALIFTKEQMMVVDLAMLGATEDQINQYMRAYDATKTLREEQEAQKKVLEEAKKLYEDTRTPIEQLAEQENRLAELLAQGAITWDTYARAVMKANDAYNPQEKKKDIDDLAKAFEDMGSVIGKAFEDAIVGGKGFSDILKALEQDILRILMRQLVTKPLNDFVSGFVTSFLPGKESGGPVMGNSAYIVGERGPEVFVPSIAGNIVPTTQTAQMLSSVGSGQNITINISTPDAQSFRSSMGQTTAQVARMMGRARRNM